MLCLRNDLLFNLSTWIIRTITVLKIKRTLFFKLAELFCFNWIPKYQKIVIPSLLQYRKNDGDGCDLSSCLISCFIFSRCREVYQSNTKWSPMSSAARERTSGLSGIKIQIRTCAHFKVASLANLVSPLVLKPILETMGFWKGRPTIKWERQTKQEMSAWGI